MERRIAITSQFLRNLLCMFVVFFYTHSSRAVHFFATVRFPNVALSLYDIIYHIN